MKKVLSLGLAAAMMTSTAFAATISTKNILPGAEIKINMDNFSDTNSLYVGGAKAIEAYNPLTAAKSDGSEQISAKTFKVSTTNGNGTTIPVVYYNTPANKKLGATWIEGTYSALANATGFGLDVAKISKVAEVAVDTDADITAAKKAIDRVARQDIKGYDFTAQNFRATLKAAKGQTLVKSVTFDGTGNLIVTFKEDYRLPSTNGAPDFVVTELSVQSIRDVKNASGTETVLYSGRKFSADPKTAADGVFNNEDTTNPVTVGVVTTDVPLYAGTEHTMNGDGSWEKFSNGDAYRATTKYEDNSLMVTGTVYSGDVTSFKVGTELSQPVISVLQNNPNAKIEVYPIVAKGFKTGFTVAIKPTMVAGASADASGNVEVLSAVAANNKKIYTVSDAGVVTAAAFTYNATTGNWEGRIPATGATILVSDVALLGATAAATPNTTVTNPGTGFGINLASAIVG